MKLTAIFLGLALSFSVGYGQLVNPDFEEWNGNDPVGWLTYNFAFPAVEPSGNAFSGDLAAHLMISEMAVSSPLLQTITSVEVEDVITFEVHYAALTEGALVNFGAVAFLDGQSVDGGGGYFDEVNQPYQLWSAEWEPRLDSYDSLRVMLVLDVAMGPVVGSVIVDNVVLSGISLGVRARSDVEVDNWKLDAAYPNPFNAATTIGFSVPLTGSVELAVYDLAGRRVATLAGGIYTPGSYQVMWDGTGDLGIQLGTGVYIMQLNARGHSHQTRTMLIK